MLKNWIICLLVSMRSPLEDTANDDHRRPAVFQASQKMAYCHRKAGSTWISHDWWHSSHSEARTSKSIACVFFALFWIHGCFQVNQLYFLFLLNMDTVSFFIIFWQCLEDKMPVSAWRNITKRIGDTQHLPNAVSWLEWYAGCSRKAGNIIDQPQVFGLYELSSNMS